MSLTTPNLLSQPTFNALTGTPFGNSIPFRFLITGGDEPKGSKLYVQDISSSGDSYVYQGTSKLYPWYKGDGIYEHSMPINSISNEKQYRAFLTTYNDDGTSSVSNIIVFWAISTPVVLGANYIQGLSYSSYNFIFNYSPGIGNKELLKSYNIKLYDENDVLTTSTGVKTVSYSYEEHSGEYTFSRTFTGLQNGSRYHIDVDIVTEHDFIDTYPNVFDFSVYYIESGVGSDALQLNNLCDEGRVEITVNLSSLPGTGEGDIEYIDNKEADLRTKNKKTPSVTWDKNIVIPDGYVLRVWGRDFDTYETIGGGIPNVYNIMLENEIKQVGIFYNEDKEENLAWFELHADNHPDLTSIKDVHVVFSDAIPIPKDKDQLFLWVKYVDNLFELIIENLGEQT